MQPGVVGGSNRPVQEEALMQEVLVSAAAYKEREKNTYQPVGSTAADRRRSSLCWT